MPVLLPGKFHGLRSLVGYSPWSHKESDMAERLHFTVPSLGLTFWEKIFWSPWSNWSLSATSDQHLVFLSQFFHPMNDIYSSFSFSLLRYTQFMEKSMATHSSTLDWKIPRRGETGRLQSIGSLRVGHDWMTSLSLFAFMRWRRKWKPTPLFLPGESQARGRLVGCHLWGRIESDMTEAT